MVDGRRWRATDPAIPDRFRQELVDELMDARRAVGAAKRARQADAEAAARARVQQAKVALGERGEPWWEPPTPEGRERRLAAVVSALAEHRGPRKTICPSDAARAVGGDDWRPLMEETRQVVRGLAGAGAVEVTQRGRPLEATAEWHGPIRVRAVDRS